MWELDHKNIMTKLCELPCSWDSEMQRTFSSLLPLHLLAGALLFILFLDNFSFPDFPKPPLTGPQILSDPFLCPKCLGSPSHKNCHPSSFCLLSLLRNLLCVSHHVSLSVNPKFCLLSTLSQDHFVFSSIDLSSTLASSVSPDHAHSRHMQSVTCPSVLPLFVPLTRVLCLLSVLGVLGSWKKDCGGASPADPQ